MKWSCAARRGRATSLVCFGASWLGAHGLLFVPAALFLVMVVSLAAATYAVDEVLQKQFERIQELEHALAAKSQSAC